MKASRKADCKICYELEVVDWAVSTYFHILPVYSTRFSDKKASFSSNVIIQCNILFPKIKNIESVQVILFPFEYDKRELIEKLNSSKRDNIGYIVKERGGDVMKFYTMYPADVFNSLHTSFGFNKIKYLSIFGDKTRYGQGNIYSINMDTERFDCTE